MKKVRARPRRIPAFGEWNYYDDGGYGYGDGDGNWPATQYLDSAMQAGLVVALPASPKPLKKVVKWSDSGTLEVDGEQRQKVVVGLREEHEPKKQGKPIEIYVKVSDAADDAHLSTTPRCKTNRVRAVKAVDEDLYVIPPDMLRHNNPRKRLTKRLWIGCLGCVSA